MIYLTLKEVILLIVSVAALTIMIYNKIINKKIKYKKCTFISVD